MMKRSRKELKTLAKRALSGNYGTVVGSMLLGYLVMFAMMIPIMAVVVIAAVNATVRGPLLPGAMTGWVIGLGIWYILVLIAGTLFMMGSTRICYLFCIGQSGGIGDLLYAFKHHPCRFIGLSFLILLITLLGSLPGIIMMICGQLMVGGGAGIMLYLTGHVLTFFLGMIAVLRYSMAIFVLIEEPYRTVGECICLSKDMMAGNKMRLFKLHVSFIGVLLLGYLTFGLGSLWITPYMISTNIFFYLSVKEEKYSTVSGISENTLNE